MTELARAFGGVTVACTVGLFLYSACGGTAIIDAPLDGAGGAGTGGAGGDTVSNSAVVVSSAESTSVLAASTQGPSQGPSVGTSVTTTGGGECQGCGDFLQGNADFEDLCSNSMMLYENFVNCVCSPDPNVGFCFMECMSACNGGELSDACNDCLFSGCGEPLNACLNDV